MPTTTAATTESHFGERPRMSHVTITLPDGSTRSMPAGATVRELAESISPRLASAALAGVVDDRLVDLTARLERDARVRVVTNSSPGALALYRHSTAHLMAAAVTSLFPGAQCGIGPATDEGFFYDFVVDRPFVPEDLEAIERKMKELAAQDLIYERQMWPKAEARAFFESRGEPLKVQLIDEKAAAQDEVSCYTIKDKETFIDFCVGPHVPSTGKLKAFKLLHTSNAYWKGDARNQPMQRIYGTAFFSDQELQAYLKQLEEAKKRDHRKLGRELGLFTFHPWAPGSTFWLDAGTRLYNTLANYMRDVLFPAGYMEVKTPLVFNQNLWETSGHWQHYRENMMLIESEGVAMSLKPMNCPGHFLLYASQARSYRDLPLRFHEQTPLHRNEASGVLSGLVRVRQFSQDDAHCFVTEDQIADEIERLLRLVQRVYADFGLEYTAKLSTRPEEFLGEIATWDHAESQLKTALEARRAGVHDQRGRRRVLWPEDRLRHHRRHRPQMAVRHHSARLRAASALRSEVHRRRQHRASPGRRPPGHLRQPRALHRAAHRALCRRPSDVAGAGAGDCAAHLRPAPRLRTRRAERPGRGRPARGAR